MSEIIDAEEIGRRIEVIRGLAMYDPEAAGVEEVRLYKDVLRAISRLEGGYAPALAYEALGASSIEFSRMY